MTTSNHHDNDNIHINNSAMPFLTATAFVSRADGIAPSLLIQCNKKSPGRDEIISRLCFNLPESIARLASTHGIDLRNVTAYFLLSGSFENMGGFPSAFLNARRRNPPVTPFFIGPPGWQEAVAFYGRLNTTMESAKCRATTPGYISCYEDACIHVCGISTNSFVKFIPPWLSAQDEIIDLLSDSEDETHLTLRRNLSDASEIINLLSDDETKEAEVDMGSLSLKPSAPCRGRKRREKGVLVIPCKRSKYRRHQPHSYYRFWCFALFLKATGETVFLLFLPNLETFDSVMSHPLMRCLTNPKTPIKAMFHMSDPELMATEVYKKWMETLIGEQIVIDGAIGEGSGMDVGLTKVMDRSLHLRAAARYYFPLPTSFDSSLTPNGVVFPSRRRLKKYRGMGGVAIGGEMPPRTRTARLLTQFTYERKHSPLIMIPSPLQPIRPGLFISEKLRFNARLKEMVMKNDTWGLSTSSLWENFLPLFSGRGFPSIKGNLDQRRIRLASILEQYQKIIGNGQPPQCLVSMAVRNDPSSIFFLGTGCAEPSPWRGGSSILIRFGDGQKAILLDCGEGTHGQMIRYFGQKGAQEMVDNLLCVWISHHHVDHCAGLAMVLDQRSWTKPPVSVFAPKTVQRYLAGVSERCIFHPNYEMERPRSLMTQLGIRRWRSVRVAHSVEAYAIRIDFFSGFSLVYSGDTGPCGDLVSLGHGCTLLIHESTHSCADVEAARKTKHSTWGEALETGRRMGAYRTILTHFSRRYPGLPTGLTFETLGCRASVAFDGMLVKIIDLLFLPYFNESIEEALKEIEFGGDLVSSDEDTIDLISEQSNENKDQEL